MIVRERIPPLAERDLPERKLNFWRMAGPGAIMAGLAIGAGEMAVWPWVTTKFGATMVWAAALGVFLQLWINFEIGRWAIATGEHPYTGFARKWMGYVYAMLSISFLGLFLPGWARLSGVAFKALLFGPDGPGADWMWTGLTFVFIAAMLFGPKVMYTVVEKAIGLMVVVITVGLSYVALSVGTLDALREMGSGLLNFGHIELDDEFTFARFFGAVVFAGIGGAGNLWYAFYLRDKNIGMGAHIPQLVNPLRNPDPVELQTGFIPRDTSENTKRFRSWFRYVKQDQVLFFFILNSLTMFLFMFGALTVLRPQGIVPAESQLVWDEAVMLEHSLGSFGRYLFLVIGISALFSSQLGNVDGGARTWSYVVGSMFEFGKKKSQSFWYGVFAVVFMVMGTASTAVLEVMNISALGFIFNAALLGGFAMAIYVPLVLYLNLTQLPRPLRPGPVHVVMVVLAALVYISFAGYTLWQLVF